MTADTRPPFSRRGPACAELLDGLPTQTFNSRADDDTRICITVSQSDKNIPFDTHAYRSYSDARSAIDTGRARGAKSILVSLSGWGSYDPLRICKEDLQRLVIDENIDKGFASVVAAFGELPRHSEQGFGCCSKASSDDGSYVISYLLRFATKDDGGNWKIRQIGVYQQYTRTTEAYLWVFLQSHPETETAFSKRLSQAFEIPDGRDVFQNNPFCLHELLFDTYIHDWRWLMNTLGRNYGKQSSIISTVNMKHEGAFGLTLDTLQDCKKLLEDLLALPALFAASVEIVAVLSSIEENSGTQNRHASASIHRPALEDLRRSSEVLIKQTQGIVDLLGNTLDLKNQRDAAQTNNHLLGLTLRTTKDSETIRVVTLGTLFYLPATFLATLFGMNFFDFDHQTRSIILSDDIWIYAVFFVPLTGLTIFSWWLWMRISVRPGRYGSFELGTIVS